MSLFRLLLREAQHRWFGFVLSLLAVAAAVGLFGSLLWRKRTDADVVPQPSRAISTRLPGNYALAVGGGKVFCIYGLSPGDSERLRRRGREDHVRPVLMALDSRDGRPIWRHTLKAPYATWLAYSEEHDVLLQTAHPLRLPQEKGAASEVGWRGSDGKVLWQRRPLPFLSPPHVLIGTFVVSQEPGEKAVGKGGYAFRLLTGEPALRRDPITGEERPWGYRRSGGCNYVIGSSRLLTFRSSTAGYFDMLSGGTGSFGGFRTGCKNSVIAADGVLTAIDVKYPGCVCNFPIRNAWLALAPSPDADAWTTAGAGLGKGRIRRIGINLGAPGDRLSRGGTLWIEIPVVGGLSPPVRVIISPEDVRSFRRHPLRVTGDLPWVAASGLIGVRTVSLRLNDAPEGPTAAARRYTVRLVFAEPEGGRPEGRSFDVDLQGRTVLRNLRVATEAGGSLRSLLKEFRGISATSEIVVSFRPRQGEPLLCGMEVVEEGFQAGPSGVASAPPERSERYRAYTLPRKKPPPLKSTLRHTRAATRVYIDLEAKPEKTRYAFLVPREADYVIWAEVRAPDYRHDSFFVAVDDGEEDIFDISAKKRSDAWRWDRVKGRGRTGLPGELNPGVFHLRKGRHVLRFRPRGPTGVRRILITDDLDYVPREQGD